MMRSQSLPDFFSGQTNLPVRPAEEANKALEQLLSLGSKGQVGTLSGYAEISSSSISTLDAVKSFVPAKPLKAAISQGQRETTLRPNQLWEGEVTVVNERGFLAVLTDKTVPTNPAEEVSLSIEDISDDERMFVVPGAAFYWTIGKQKSPAGQVRNVSIIQFKRGPKWTSRRLARSATRARRLKALFSEDE